MSDVRVARGAATNATVHRTKGEPRASAAKPNLKQADDGSFDPTDTSEIQARLGSPDRAMEQDARRHSYVARVDPAGTHSRTHHLLYLPWEIGPRSTNRPRSLIGSMVLPRACSTHCLNHRGAHRRGSVIAQPSARLTSGQHLAGLASSSPANVAPLGLAASPTGWLAVA